MKRASTSPRNSKCIVTIINPLVENDQNLECRICFESDGKLLSMFLFRFHRICSSPLYRNMD